LTDSVNQLTDRSIDQPDIQSINQYSFSKQKKHKHIYFLCLVLALRL